MMTKLVIELSSSEWNELQRVAIRELRGLKDQARWLIVRGLEIESTGETQSNAKPAKAKQAEAQL